MPYLYDDEDNDPMNDDAMKEDPYLKYTTYSCKAEEDAWENGDIDRKIEIMETARDIRNSQILEGFLDDMEIPRGSECRSCPWIKEAIVEQYVADDDNMLPPDAYEVAHRMCAVCNAHSKEEQYEALQAFFEEEEKRDG